jgi:hypothetical protein
MSFILTMAIHSSFCEQVGAALCGSLGCVTLHAVGFDMEPVTIMPHARGKAPIEHDQPATRQSGVTIDEDGRAPRVAAGFPAAIPMRL